MLTKRIGKSGKVNRVKILFVLLKLKKENTTLLLLQHLLYVFCPHISHLCHDIIGKPCIL